MRPKRTIPRICRTCGAAFLAWNTAATRPERGHWCNAVCYHAYKIAPDTRRLKKTDCSGGTDACWPFTGKRNRNGYGIVTITKEVTVLAHRVALESALGFAIPEGFNALHSCDNPPCCRNDEPGIYVIRGIARPRYGHLWLGTQADNVADMVAKRRHWLHIEQPAAV